jgi:hypothetical protein
MLSIVIFVTYSAGRREGEGKNMLCVVSVKTEYDNIARRAQICKFFCSVADPGCSFRIPDPNFSIPDLRIRIRIKEFKYF